jgi:acetyltransferase-like isoleucine patch superfamily enzyme
MNLVSRFGAALVRDRDLPIAVLARKLGNNALALASARVFLRDADRVGEHARCFGGRPHVDNGGTLFIGDDFAANCEFGTVRLATAERGVLHVGHGVTINYGTSISARRMVSLGDRVMIGPYCVIADTELPLPLRDDEPARPIEIRDGVWLGARVVVLPGATIGAGAVISAGSVVSGDVPPGAVAAGNPARVLRISDAAAA